MDPGEEPNKNPVAPDINNPSPSCSYSTNDKDLKRDNHDDNDSSDDDMACPICFEDWNNSSSHRLVSLKCGHLFGKSCVERWLKGNQQCCPQCKVKSKKSDIRNVYAKAIKVRDTSDRDRALKELEAERAIRLNLELEVQTLKVKLSHAQMKLEKERRGKEAATTVAVPMDESSEGSENIKLALSATFEVRDGKCRVMATLPNLNILTFSQYTPHKMFPGYGMKKVYLHSMTGGQYIPLHKDTIRDARFHPGRQNGLLLTTSTDKTIKLTCMNSHSVAHTLHTEQPGWACEWSLDNDNYFYGGFSDGSVLLYDIRQTNSYVARLPSTGSPTPVVSLRYLPSTSMPLNSGGLIVGQLNRCSFLESTPKESKLHVLPVKGPITSVSLEPNLRHMLVSCRPNSENPVMSHSVYNINTSNNECECNFIGKYVGGNMENVLVKNLLMQNPFNDKRLLAISGDESTQSTMIWDVQCGEIIQRLNQSQPVVAVDSCVFQDRHSLVTLCVNALNIYDFK